MNGSVHMQDSCKALLAVFHKTGLNNKLIKNRVSLMFINSAPVAEPLWPTGWLSDCQLLGEECCMSSDSQVVQRGKCP